MNEPNDNEHIDDDVRAAYRDASKRVRTPRALDRAVLAAAGNAARKRYLPAWTRPAAFAATLVLGVALLFEMQRDLQEQLPPASGDGPVRRQAVTPAPIESPQESRAVAPAAKPGVPAADLASPSGPQRQDREDAADAGTSFSDAAVLPAVSAPQPRLQTDTAQAVADETENRAADRAAPGTASKSEIREREPQCTEEQRREPASWQACIDALDNGGHHDAARQERERLRARFPEFSAPE